MANTQKEIDEQILKAEKAFANKAYEKSVTTLSSIIQENPNYAPAYRKLAAIHLRTKTPETALPLINKTLELAPDDFQNWNMLGHYHVLFRIWDKALDAFMHSLKLTGNNEATEYEIAKIYRSMGDKKRYFTALEKLVAKYPDTMTYSFKYGLELYNQERFYETLKLYDHLIHTHPLSDLPLPLINGWRTLMQKFDRSDEVLVWAKQQNESFPDSAIVKWMLGVVYVDLKQYDLAEDLLMQAYALDQTNTEIIYSLAYLLYTRAQKEEALFYFDKFFELKPVSPKALRLAASLKKINYGDKLFMHLNYAAAFLPELAPYEKTELHYALGKAYDDVGEIKTAFAHFKQGGKYHSEGKKSGVETLETLLHIYKEHFDTAYFTKHHNSDLASRKPVFILGMPRSGTTLTESILSAHQGVFGAGELSHLTFSLEQLLIGNFKFQFDYSGGVGEKDTYRERGAFYLSKTESLGPEGTSRIIDKMPDNFKYAGFIPLLLPGASIIHTRRHPVEVCLSAYRLLFVSGHYWSDDLREMGRYYRLYHEIMQHWHDVLPKGTVLDVRYEDMVNDPQTHSKRITEYIGVAWDPKCLEFYNTEKSVQTASALQVKQPIYKSSINRWKKYEPYLEPLLDEIGDLVEAYEAELKNSR